MNLNCKQTTTKKPKFSKIFNKQTRKGQEKFRTDAGKSAEIFEAFSRRRFRVDLVMADRQKMKDSLFHIQVNPCKYSHTEHSVYNGSQ